MTDREAVTRHARIFGYIPNLNSINYISMRIKKLSELIKGDTHMNDSYIGEMQELMSKINSSKEECVDHHHYTVKRSIEISKKKSVQFNKTIEKA